MADFKNIFKDAYTGVTLDTNTSSYKRTYEENQLHRYASYNYVFTLSGLTRQQLANPKRILSDPLHDIIARTGGIGSAQNFANYNTSTMVFSNDKFEGAGSDEYARSLKTTPTLQERANFANRILQKNRDIYFERVEITSIPGPNIYRKLMNYTTIEMTLSEPNGISFWQKVRAAAYNGGYLEHPSAPFLLTIEFKGFDSKGVEVANDIVRRMPIELAQSSISVNAGGTTYTVSAVPWTEVASQNRYLFTRAQGSIEGKGDDLSSYLKDFETKLNAAQEREVQEKFRQIPDEYKITADFTIGKAVNLINSYGASTGEAKDQLSVMTYGREESIGYILEKFVRQFDQYRKIDEIVKKYWANVQSASTYDSNAKLPAPWVPWFKIVTTVELGNKWDSILQSHNRTIHFHIKDYRIHVANFAQAGLAGYGFWKDIARKKYNYIYTGQNLDILDLNIEYNSNYVKASLINEPYVTQQKANTSLFDKVIDFWSAFLSGGTNNVTEGNTPYPEPELPLRNVVTTATSDDGTTKGKEDATKVQAFYDFLTNNYGDMVTLEMKIMGDPAYIGEDYFIPMSDPGDSQIYSKKEQVGSLFGFDWDDKKKCFNFDEYQPVVSLDFRFPSDFSENQGLYEFTKEDTPQFTGLYKVNTVTSTFDNGQFTQLLKMYRFENQNNPSQTPTQFKSLSSQSNKTETQIKGGSDPAIVDPDTAFNQ